MRYWNTLNYKTPWYFGDMERQEHILIGGTTGSGKSTVLNGLMLHLLQHSPSTVQFILLDPKGIELVDYEKLPHTIQYAYTIEEMNQALLNAERIRQKRFEEMRTKGVKKYDGSHIYIVIDEYACIGGKYGTASKESMKALTNIAFLGRASNMHIVACTQRPTREIIDGLIANNFTTTLALRTDKNQDSRNLIGIGGCENLPKYGKAYYKTPSETSISIVDTYTVPEDMMQNTIQHWKREKARMMN